MSAFERLLAERNPDPAGRRWVFVTYDQLSGEIGPLAKEGPGQLGVVLVENRWQLARRPYHKQKLAHLLANARWFALEQAGCGVAVRYIVGDRPYREVLAPLADELGPMEVMEPAERELRADIEPLVESGAVVVTAHEGWLTTREQFFAAQPKGPPWRMDAFYRHMRKETGVLMQRGKPAGGKLSLDAENRKPWRGTPRPPEPPRFDLDAVKEEVGKLIESEFAHHPGMLDLEAVPATQDDVESLWAWAKRNCLKHFGPYEDAMSTASAGLFHTRLSAVVNLHRLLPARLVAESAKASAPLSSREGFIRQVLGWREFVRHVHLASDGFRRLPSGDPDTAQRPGDAGYARWTGDSWPASANPDYLDGGAEPCALGCDAPLPNAYWGARSGLRCLDQVVADVWREAWSHHITRLVVLGSIATMLDVSPRELTDWFWIAYSDAYDWVVEPNVLGMGMFAVGDAMSTKPYVTGAAYINRMSDYCAGCAFSPRRNCPLTDLYWAFLARHEGAVRGNPRVALQVASMRRRSSAQRRADRAVFRRVQELLGEDRELTPTAMERARAQNR